MSKSKRIVVGRLTLGRTWELCLLTWKWIAKQRTLHPRANVWVLKEQWLEDHNIEGLERYANCFFCRFAERGVNNDFSCRRCPAVKVDPDFNCRLDRIHYSRHPRLFYKELVRLNKKRLSKKGNK